MGAEMKERGAQDILLGSDGREYTQKDDVRRKKRTTSIWDFDRTMRQVGEEECDSGNV